MTVKERPVVMEITINRPWWRFEMNKPEFSAYHDTDNEVLIQDGTCMIVTKVEEVKKDKDILTYVHLKFIGHGGFLD